MLPFNLIATNKEDNSRWLFDKYFDKTIYD